MVDQESVKNFQSKKSDNCVFQYKKKVSTICNFVVEPFMYSRVLLNVTIITKPPGSVVVITNFEKKMIR